MSSANRVLDPGSASASLFEEVRALDNGVPVNTNGLACPSTVMGDAEIDEVVDAMQRSLRMLPR